MAFGGFHPWPKRFGVGGPPLLQRVFESLAAARGSAYDQTTTSAVGIENMALARAVTFDGHSCVTKMANEFTPQRCTAAGLLPRWELIFGTPPQIGDTEPTRRARVAAAWMRLAQGNWVQAVIDQLSAGLGPLYVGMYFLTPSTAATSWPGGSITPGLPWYSTLLIVSVQLTIPPAYQTPGAGPNAAWWAAASTVGSVLDPLIPAWCTWQFWVVSSHGGAGFYLDEPDLDLEIFDV